MPRFEHIDNQLLCVLITLIFDKKSNNSTMVQLFLFTFKRQIRALKKGKRDKKNSICDAHESECAPVKCEPCTIILPEFIS